ncbi:MAG: portal protein [Geminicoccaceae bacterium]
MAEDAREEDYQHPELRNVALDLTEEERGEIAGEGLEGLRSDDESRSEWLSMHADWLRLFFQKDRPKNPPWEGASTEAIPILAEACNQFHARAYQAMFPSRRIIRAIPTGKTDAHSRDRAERVETHMSWQLLVRNKNYKRDKDRLLLGVPLHGSAFTKTYYCPIRERNITDNVRAVDLVVPYGTGPRNIEDIERKTHIVYTPINRAKILHNKGFFMEEPVPFEPSYKQGEKTEVDQAHDEAQGVQETNYHSSAYARILEQHTFLDLDEDGIPEPYIAWIDGTSEKLLRLSVRYDTDENGEPTDDKEPVECFTHYPFIENPDGFYGLGFGHLIGMPNEAVNKLLRQTIDAATLANVGNHSGFVSNALGVQGGELQMQLGKFLKIPGSTEDINRAIFQFKFPGPSNVNGQVIELLMKRSDRLATVTEAITGQTEKVMQPTTIMALIDQSLQIFSTVYERILTAWGDELEKHYRLNRKHMDPEEYFAVLDVTGAIKEGHAAREDYEEDHQIQPIADPKQTTQRQKLAKAEAEWAFAIGNPLILNSPQHFYNASKRYLMAIEAEGIDEILPEPQGEMIRVDDPVQENVGALSPIPMVPPAFPDQDHVMHIKAHTALLQDPEYGAHMTDLGRQRLEEHINVHAALMYGQVETTENAGIPGMEAAPGNGALPEEAEGSLPAELAGGGNLGPGQPPEGSV